MMRPPDLLEIDVVDSIAVVTFDIRDAAVNTLSAAAREAFGALVERLERDAAIRAAVLVSGKADSWIAGADIDELSAIRSAAQAEALSRAGHAMLDRLERLRVPVIAAIHGACLGGGLEVALACAYRIASDHPRTVLALPEVQLGLIPGGGGTQRLPRLVGVEAALDMILTGRNVRAKKALRIGLVNEVVHPAILREIALTRAGELAERTRARAPRRKRGAKTLLLDANPLGRSIVFRKAREQTLAKTKGQYPAPLAALDAVKAGLDGGMARGLEDEARLFGEMAVSDVSRQLVFLFFATTALKKDPGVAEPAPSPRPVHKIGILGAGFMGAGIASVAAQAGTIVRLKDADLARVGKGLASVRDIFAAQLAKKRITRHELDDRMSLVSGTVAYTGFGNVDLVIEAVFEDLAVKQAVLREIEAVSPEDVIIASNTSTIPIARIAEASARPERVIGMHFFSPVQKMPLLEVIRHARTDPEVTATAVAYGKALGKTIIVVSDAPGFYVNRILAPYLNEAGRMLELGVPVDTIDRALVRFGFPVGPITLLDEVGLDIAAKSGPILAEAFGARLAPPPGVARLVAAGRLGRKARKGFYQYDADGEKGEVDQSVYGLLRDGAPRQDVPADDIARQCVLAMVNEAVRCLEDGIIRSPRDGDVGAVFGIGFPPFRGGPFRYVDAVGAGVILRQLEALHDAYAPRFEPAALLMDLATGGRRFYQMEGRPG